jgi:hypothetical protein
MASARGMGMELNVQGHTTRRGKPWNQMQVSRILDRVEVTPDKPPSLSVG